MWFASITGIVLYVAVTAQEYRYKYTGTSGSKSVMNVDEMEVGTISLDNLLF